MLRGRGGVVVLTKRNAFVILDLNRVLICFAADATSPHVPTNLTHEETTTLRTQRKRFS